MIDQKPHNLLEILVGIAIAALLIVIASMSVYRGRQTVRDTQRRDDLQMVVEAYKTAAQRGWFLCEPTGTSACAAGQRLRDCHVYSAPCGRGGVDKTSEVMDQARLQDPHFANKDVCMGKAYAECDYAFLEFQDLTHFRLGFSSEGWQVNGLSAGQTHVADQNGIVE